jgi:perosamine synthetase
MALAPMSDPAQVPAPDAAGYIPLSVPYLGGNEWEYVKECLDTNWVSSRGSYVDRFERMVAEYAGCRHAVATVNGTAALHIALLLAGVQPGDEVLVSDLTFIAPVNAIRYAGARPVLVDADPDYWQMDPAKLDDFLRSECVAKPDGLYNRASGHRVKAIVPVHILGHPCDMDPILVSAGRYGLTVLGDATESLGALYKGIPVGRLGDAACLSFNGNKLITTGGGGMLITDNDAWAARARYLTTQAKDDPLEFVHGEVGYNYRLTNVQAAIGVAQMERIGEHVAAKRRIYETYKEGLADVPGVEIMREAPWARSTLWLTTVLIDQARYGEDSRTLMRRLAAQGIETRPLWQAMHQSPAHRDAQCYRCQVSERLTRDALSIPSSVGLTGGEQARVIAAIARTATA